MSGRAVPQQGSILPRGAGRPGLRAARRCVPVPAVVVRRVGRSAGGRPAAHSARPSGLPPGRALRSVLARPAREGLRKVSTHQTQIHEGGSQGYHPTLKKLAI